MEDILGGIAMVTREFAESMIRDCNGFLEALREKGEDDRDLFAAIHRRRAAWEHLLDLLDQGADPSLMLAALDVCRAADDDLRATELSLGFFRLEGALGHSLTVEQAVRELERQSALYGACGRGWPQLE